MVVILGVIEREEYVWPSHVSRWWRDIVRMEEANWFNTELYRRVGNGVAKSFWEVVWSGEVAFRHKYPRLFALSNQ